MLQETVNAGGLFFQSVRRSTSGPRRLWMNGKLRGEFHEDVARDQALREKLEKASAKIEIANLGYIYKDPNSLVSFIKKHCQRHNGPRVLAL